MDLKPVLTRVLEQFDASVQGTHQSQISLLNEVERLSAELQLYVDAQLSGLADQTQSRQMNECLERVAVCQKQLMQTNGTMQTLLRRLEAIQKRLSTSTPTTTTTTTTTPTTT